MANRDVIVACLCTLLALNDCLLSLSAHASLIDEPAQVSCTPAVTRLEVGGSATVTCNVAVAPLTTISTTHLPEQLHHMWLRRERTAYGYRFLINFERVNLDHNREYCLLTDSSGGKQRACYRIEVAANQPVHSDPPPQPEITSVESTDNAVTYSWTLLSDGEGNGGARTPFVTEVSVVSHDFMYGKRVLSGETSVSFDNLQPHQQHRITVTTKRGSQTRSSQRTVLTTSLDVKCPPVIDVALKAYAFNAHRAPPTAYSMRAKCNTTIPVADAHIQAPDFIKARGTNSSPKAHNHIRLSNRRNHQVMPLKDDQHCIRVSAAQKQPVQSCFKLNVTRPLTAVIQDVLCRSRNCSAMGVSTTSGANSGTRRILGCFVTGYPLPRNDQVQWTYDGEQLSPRAHASWVRRVLGCRAIKHHGEDVRLCKVKVSAASFLGVNPRLLRCSAHNDHGNTAQTIGTSSLLNRTELHHNV